MNPLQQESSYELIEDHKDYLCGKISDNVCAAFFRVAQKYPEVLPYQTPVDEIKLVANSVEKFVRTYA